MHEQSGKTLRLPSLGTLFELLAEICANLGIALQKLAVSFLKMYNG